MGLELGLDLNLDLHNLSVLIGSTAMTPDQTSCPPLSETSEINFVTTSRMSNGTKPGVSLVRRLAIMAYGTVSSVLALFILVCNAVFIVACWRTRALRTLSTLHVISLSGSDMLQGVGMLLNMVFILTLDSGDHTLLKYLCLGVLSTFMASMSITFINIAFIAVDRYIYIVHPFRYQRVVTARRSKVCISLAWLSSTPLGFSMIFNNFFTPEVGCRQAVNRYYSWIRITIFLVTSVVSGFCHVPIQLTAMMHIKKINPNRASQPRNAHVKTTTAASLRLVKTFCLVYVLQLVCWLPGLVAFSIGYGEEKLMNGLAILAQLSAVFNVLVYIFSNSQFKNAMVSVLRCQRHQNKHNYTESGRATN